MEHPIAVANYFVQKSFECGEELTPMKLVKLVYISHGWHLALHNDELLSEAVQAWKYGPVVASVYNAFHHFGRERITSLHREPGRDQNELLVDKHAAITPLLDKIWEAYKQYDGLQLSTLTHQAGTPWDITWNQAGGRDTRSAIIPNNLIKAYYKAKMNANRNQEL